MLTISPIQSEILRGLWTYKFLTAQQLLKLSNGRHLQSIYAELRVLREKNIIGAIVYWGVSRTWTLQKLHYLTPKGACIVGEIRRVDLDEVRYPKSTNTLVKNDFVHRINTIDLWIAYDMRIANSQFDPLFFDVYFDTVGSQRWKKPTPLQGKTRIKVANSDVVIDPDAVFAYDDTEELRLFVLEVANGHDTLRIINQVENIVFAMYCWAISDKYKLEKTPYLLFAFEHISTQKAVMEQVLKNPYLIHFNKLTDYLFFSNIETIKNDRINSRINANGESIHGFDIPNQRMVYPRFLS